MKTRIAKSMPRIWAARGLLAVIGLVMLSCSGTDSTEGWDLDPPPPESTVNLNMCQALSERAPDTMKVVRGEDPSTWRIEYPIFKSSCGVYQLDAVLQIDGDSTADSSYRHEIAVCNRCESPHTWNYLEGDVAAGLDTEESDDRPIPETPERNKLNDYLPQTGAPVVGHASETTPTSRYEVWCEKNVAQVIREGRAYWRLENVFYFQISPDSTRRYTVRRNYRKFRSAWLETTSGEESVTTTIRWPRLFHQNDVLSGAHAASAQQYCVEQSDQNTGLQYSRPFAEPYRSDLKYTTQRVTRPEIPSSLVDSLKRQSP